jgi:hypothetical protein
MFQLSDGQPKRPPMLSFGDDGPPSVQLTDKYRPRRLADLLGNGFVRKRLEEFTARPHSHAFLFEGPTGIGKTSAALALANELGVHPTAGLWVVKSGDQDVDSMSTLANEFRFAPMSPWRAVIIEEADWMLRAPKVANLWLSILDDLPTRTVFVFTSNFGSKFPERFLDRCEHCPFSADAASLRQEAQLLVNRIWKAETGRTDPPDVASLGVEQEGLISFRRVVRAIEPLIRSNEHARRARAAEPRARVDASKVTMDRTTGRLTIPKRMAVA